MKLSHFAIAGLVTIGLMLGIMYLVSGVNVERPGSGPSTDATGYPSLEDYRTVFYAPLPEAQSSLDRIDRQWKSGSAIMLLEMHYWLDKKPIGAAIREVLVDHLKLGKFDRNAARKAIWALDYDPHPEYAEFKNQMYSLLDMRFASHFHNGVPAVIRLDEIVWGGVVRDGIPPLREPEMIPATEAAYLADDNIVFGVEINGDARAYPRRILAWHEMFTDTIGGIPLAGVY